MGNCFDALTNAEPYRHFKKKKKTVYVDDLLLKILVESECIINFLLVFIQNIK